MCIPVINFFWCPHLRFRVAQIDVWSANFLHGSGVEIKGRVGVVWVRFGGMVWEQLTCNFSVGSGMYAMLCVMG